MRRNNSKLGEGSCRYCRAWIWWRESKEGRRYMSEPNSRKPHAIDCKVLAIQPRRGTPRLTAAEKAFSVDIHKTGPTSLNVEPGRTDQ